MSRKRGLVAIGVVPIVLYALQVSFIGEPLAMIGWLRIPLLLAIFVVFPLFIVALLPLPGAMLLRRFAPSASGTFDFLASMVTGMLLLFLLLTATESPSIETDGESTITRHAGPSLDASRKLFYYYYAAPVMIFSLGYYYARQSRKRGDEGEKDEIQ